MARNCIIEYQQQVVLPYRYKQESSDDWSQNKCHSTFYNPRRSILLRTSRGQQFEAILLYGRLSALADQTRQVLIFNSPSRTGWSLAGNGKLYCALSESEVVNVDPTTNMTANLQLPSPGENFIGKQWDAILSTFTWTNPDSSRWLILQQMPHHHILWHRQQMNWAWRMDQKEWNRRSWIAMLLWFANDNNGSGEGGWWILMEHS